MPVASLIVALAFAQAKPHAKPAPKVKTGCYYAGQFYNLGDKSKTPWLGVRICQVGARDHDRVTVQTDKGKKSFTVPFPAGSSSGTGWQRMAKEKSGCDLILIKTAGGSSCKWQMTTGAGALISSGKTSFNPKKLQPFSTPASRVMQRHQAPKGLKSSSPPKKKAKG